MRHRILSAVCASMLVLFGCGGGSDGPVTPPPPAVIPVASVAVGGPIPASLVAQQTVQLTATIKDAAGSALTGRAISWTVSPTSLASISESGLLTATGPGSVTATATSEGKSGSASIVIDDGRMITAAGGTVTSSNGAVSIDIPAQAVLTPTAISITAIANPLQAPGLLPSTAYELGPEGMQFAQPVRLSIRYTAAQLPAGLDPVTLFLFTRSGNAWTVLSESQSDAATRTVSGMTTHFSAWAACAWPCAIGTDIRIKTRLRAEIPPTVHQNTSIDIAGLFLRGGMQGVGGLGGSVQYSAEGLPSGLTASVSTTRSGAAYDEIRMRITANAAVAPGRYDFVMRSRANGVADGEERLIVYVAASNYALALSAAQLSIAQGASGQMMVSVVRQPGFVVPVTLVAEDVPTGATGTFSPSSVTGATPGATLTLQIPANVPPGDYTVSIRGTANGQGDVIKLLPLVVTPTTASSFTLEGMPPLVNLSPSASSSTGLRANRTGGFAGTITYTVSGLPAGIAATITATSKADSSRLNVTASGAAALGTTSFTVTATSGNISRALSISLVVAPAGNVSVPLRASCLPGLLWMAYRVDGGAFARVQPNNGIYSISTNGKGTLASVTEDDGFTSTNVQHLTLAELQAMDGLCDALIGSKVVNATVSGIINATIASVSIGGGYRETSQNGATIQVRDVASGPQDLIGFRRNQASTAPHADDRIIVRRDLNIANGGALSLDFSATEATAPATATATATGGSGSISVYMRYLSGSSCARENSLTEVFQQPSTFTIKGVPTSRQIAGDFHDLFVSDGTRGAGKLFHTLASTSIAFGAAMPTPTISTLSASPKRLQAVVTVPVDYADIMFSYESSSRYFSIGGSVAYFGAQAVTLAMPDLSAVAGFDPTWSLPAGAAVSSQLTGNSHTLFNPRPCAEGATSRVASWRGNN